MEQSFEFEFDESLFTPTATETAASTTPPAEGDADDSVHQTPNLEEAAESDEEPEVETDALEAHYEFLKSYGLLKTPEDFKFEATPESLEQALTHTKEALYSEAVKSLTTSLPPDFIPILEYALAGGDSINEYLQTLQEEVSLDDLSTSDEDGQKQVLFQYWKATSSYSDDKIRKMVARIDDPEELQKEAEDALVSLKLFYKEERDRLKQRSIEEQEKRREKQEQQVKTLSSEIQSSIEPTRQGSLKNFVLSPIKVADQTTTRLNYTLQNIFQNPKHLVQLADVLLDYDPDKGITSSRIEAKLKSKASKSFNQLVHEKLDSVPKGRKPASASEKFDLEAYINAY